MDVRRETWDGRYYRFMYLVQLGWIVESKTVVV